MKRREYEDRRIDDRRVNDNKRRYENSQAYEKSRDSTRKGENSVACRLYDELGAAIKTHRLDHVKGIIGEFNKENLDYNDSRYLYNENALHLACKQGTYEIVSFFMEHKFSPRVKNSSGHTAYHTAAYYDHRNILELLLEKHSVEVKEIVCNERRTLLHACLRNNDTVGKNQCFVFLIKKYALRMDFLDAQDKDGYSALHFAIERGNVSAVRTLLQIGVNHQLVSKAGTPKKFVLDLIRRLERDNHLDKFKLGLLAALKNIVNIFEEHEKSLELTKRFIDLNKEIKEELNDSSTVNNGKEEKKNSYSSISSVICTSQISSTVVTSQKIECESVSIANSMLDSKPLNSLSPSLATTITEDNIDLLEQYCDESVETNTSSKNTTPTKKKCDPKLEANLNVVYHAACEKIAKQKVEIEQQMSTSFTQIEKNLQKIMSDIQSLKAPVEVTKGLQTEVQQASQSLSNLSTEMNNLKSRVEALEADNSTLKEGVALAKDTARALIGEYKKLANLVIEANPNGKRPEPSSFDSPIATKRIKVSLSQDNLSYSPGISK